MTQRKTYQIKVEICSEAIFTNGEKESNLVHSRAQTDEYGFIYYHAKTLKGQLKRQALWLLAQYVAIDKEKADQFFQSIKKLFGINKEEIDNINTNCETCYEFEGQVAGTMKLSNLELDENLRKYFIYQQNADAEEDYYRLSPHDLIEAQTHIRTGIQLQEGIIKDKMMNTYHTVRKGLTFYSEISFDKGLDDIDTPVLHHLNQIVCSFRRIGAGIHRGRGEIKAELLIDGEKFRDSSMTLPGGNCHGSL